MSDRIDRWFQLARLEYEVAILLAATGKHPLDLSAPATTCRALLLEEPTYKRADEVHFFLAQVELRRGDTRLALDVLSELERAHPQSALRCQAWLLGGESWQQRNELTKATQKYRQVQVSGTCAKHLVHQAQYRQAWCLLGQKQTAAAALELRRLLERRELSVELRQRASKDLALMWSRGEPDPDAALFLARQGRSPFGARLVEALAQQLQEQGRLETLLSLTTTYLRSGLESAVAAPIYQRRLRAIAALGSVDQLQEELVTLGRLPLSQSAFMQEIMAQALAGLAGRLAVPEKRPATARDEPEPELVLATTQNLRDEPEHEPLVATVSSLREKLGPETAAGSADLQRVRQLYEQLLQSYPQTKVARAARFTLATLLLRTKDYATAASHLQKIVAHSAPPLQHRARYLLLFCLSQQIEAASTPQRTMLQKAFIQWAWKTSAADPQADTTAEVLLTLAAYLSEQEQYDQAFRASRLFLQRFSDHSRRREAVEYSIFAGQKKQQWTAIYQLAKDELARCSPTPGHPGDQARARDLVPWNRGSSQNSTAPSSHGGVVAEQKRRTSTRLTPAGADQHCIQLRRVAADAALRQSRVLADAGKLEAAQRWATRAAQRVQSGAMYWECLLAAATYAARGAQLHAAKTLYEEVAQGQSPPALGQRAIVALAQLEEARGQFDAAATHYRHLAERAGQGKDRLPWLYRAVQAYRLAENDVATRRALKRLSAMVEHELPPSTTRLRWQHKIGRLLGDTNSAQYRYYLRQARQVVTGHPEQAAFLLLHAVPLAPSLAKARLHFEAATQLASGRRSKALLWSAELKARMALARRQREQLAQPVVGSGDGHQLRRRLGALQDLASSLVFALRLANQQGRASAPANPTRQNEKDGQEHVSSLTSEASMLLAWTYQQLADTARLASLPSGLTEAERINYQRELHTRTASLDQLARQIKDKLALVGQKPGGLDTSTLTVLQERARPGIPLLRADHLPASSTHVAPILQQQRQGRLEAAIRSTSAALSLFGAQEDLLCLRGAIWIALGDYRQAESDYLAALRRAPHSRCAQLNLGGLAIWRQDYASAKKHFAPHQDEPGLTGQAAAALGLGQIERAVTLARLAITENARSEAVYLLGVLFLTNTRQSAEGLMLLRRCVQAKLQSSLRAQQILSQSHEHDRLPPSS